MIKQQYLDILNKQREDLLWRKDSENFFLRLFYRKYTDWVMTDEIKQYQSQSYYEGQKLGEPKFYKKQVSVRMKLSNGDIEVKETKI